MLLLFYRSGEANSMKQFFKEKPYNLFLIGLFIVPVVYSILRANNQGYWDGAIGNWLATMLGIIGGIPIALEINRFTLRLEEKKKLDEAKQKNRDILLLIRQELIFNIGRLKDRQSSPDALQRHPYQVDVWEAFSDSGEIKWISNMQLLNRIASAYSIIKIERFIENNAYLVAKGAFAFSGTEGALKSMLEDARSYDQVFEENTKYAISEIDKQIE